MENNRTAHAIDVLVGANLRRMRNAKHVSQSALGEVLGVSFQQVQKCEKGNNRIAASKLALAAQFLGCPLIELFAGVEQVSEAPAVVPVSAEAERVARQYDGLKNSEARNYLRRILASMARTEEIQREVNSLVEAMFAAGHEDYVKEHYPVDYARLTAHRFVDAAE